MQARQLFQVAARLQRHGPRQRGDVGWQQERHQEQQVPEPRQRHLEQAAQRAQRNADDGADGGHAQAQLERAAHQRQRRRRGQGGGPGAEGIAQRAFGQMGKDGLQRDEGHRQGDEHAQGGHGDGRQEKDAFHGRGGDAGRAGIPACQCWPNRRAKRASTSAREAPGAVSGSSARSLNSGRLPATSWRAGISQASATARWPSSDST
ncbi:Uncharacterised protein [Achromobacter ruhlandii]|nr:Uncharacterised protein [Achromobacter ruhlandii]